MVKSDEKVNTSKGSPKLTSKSNANTITGHSANRSAAMRASPASAASNKKDLDWEGGWKRFAAYKSKHASGLIPDDYSDEELVTWAKKQRLDYWKRKCNPSDKQDDIVLGEEGLQLLDRFGFNWGPNPLANAKKSVPNGAAATAPAAKENEPSDTMKPKADAELSSNSKVSNDESSINNTSSVTGELDHKSSKPRATEETKSEKKPNNTNSVTDSEAKNDEPASASAAPDLGESNSITDGNSIGTKVARRSKRSKIGETKGEEANNSTTKKSPPDNDDLKSENSNAAKDATKPDHKNTMKSPFLLSSNTVDSENSKMEPAKSEQPTSKPTPGPKSSISVKKATATDSKLENRNLTASGQSDDDDKQKAVSSSESKDPSTKAVPVPLAPSSAQAGRSDTTDSKTPISSEHQSAEDTSPVVTAVTGKKKSLAKTAPATKNKLADNAAVVTKEKNDETPTEQISHKLVAKPISRRTRKGSEITAPAAAPHTDNPTSTSNTTKSDSTESKATRTDAANCADATSPEDATVSNATGKHASIANTNSSDAKATPATTTNSTTTYVDDRAVADDGVSVEEGGKNINVVSKTTAAVTTTTKAKRVVQRKSASKGGTSNAAAIVQSTSPAVDASAAAPPTSAVASKEANDEERNYKIVCNAVIGSIANQDVHANEERDGSARSDDGDKSPIRRSTRVKAPTHTFMAETFVSPQELAARIKAPTTTSNPGKGSTSKGAGDGGAETPTNKASKRKARSPAESASKPPAKRRRRQEGTRVLKRIHGKEAEETLKLIVKKDCAKLLVPDEPVEPDAALLVTTQQAKHNQQFEARFLEFLVFTKAYGHGYVPKIYHENPSLGLWVVRMRAWKKKGDRRLTESRLRRLNEAGFVWEPKSDKDYWKAQSTSKDAEDQWESNFKLLLKYKEATGDCLVPKDYPTNQRLARWVTKQRKHYKAKSEDRYNTLDDEKERRLKEVGFCFNTKTQEIMRATVLKRFEERWDINCEKLVAFKNEFGHCAVPRRWKRDMQFASWVMRQRFQFRKMKEGLHSYLDADRIKQLEDIGFVFADIDRTKYPMPKGSSAKSSKSPVKKDGGTRKKVKKEEAVVEEGEGHINDNIDEDNGQEDDEIAEVEGHEDDAIAEVEEEEIDELEAVGIEDANIKEEQESEEESDASKGEESEVEEVEAEVDEDGDDENEEEEGIRAVEVKVEETPRVEEKPQAILNKGVWSCKVCKKNDFFNYLEAVAHEAKCFGLDVLAIKPSMVMS